MLPASAISRVCGVNVEYKNFNAGAAGFLPQRLAVIGVGNDDSVYSTEKYEATGSADAAAKRYGYGSPLHLAARQLFPEGGGGDNTCMIVLDGYGVLKPGEAPNCGMRC